MADLIDVLGVGAGLGTRAGMSPDMFTDNDPLLILPIGYTLMGNLIYLRCGEDNVPGSRRGQANRQLQVGCYAIDEGRIIVLPSEVDVAANHRVIGDHSCAATVQGDF